MILRPALCGSLATLAIWIFTVADLLLRSLFLPCAMCVGHGGMGHPRGSSDFVDVRRRDGMELRVPLRFVSATLTRVIV